MPDTIGFRHRRAGSPEAEAAYGEASVESLVRARADVDFESYAPGASTRHATLRWSPGGVATFRGTTGWHEVSPEGEDHEGRVLAHWKGFTGVARRVVEERRSSFHANQPPEGERHSYVGFGGARAALRDGEHLRAHLAFAGEADHGTYAKDGSYAVEATLRRQEDGSFVLERDGERAEVAAGTGTADLADAWEAFVAGPAAAPGPR